MDLCGEFAASFIPRWGQYFSCVLSKGHEGGPESHRAGGTCVAHGDYVMDSFGATPHCPYPPEECIAGCMKLQKESS
jgi:hypothetical protein